MPHYKNRTYSVENPLLSIDQNSKKPEVLVIIPARGGSKGLPRKNIKNLCGKPLIAYSIEIALRSNLIDRVVVSTEDEEIAEVSKNYGAEVPFLRPLEMSNDRSSIGDAVNFTVNRLREDGYYPNILVTLYPTHPFRTVGLVNLLVGKTISGYSHVVTAKMIRHNNLSVYSRDEDKRIIPLLNSNNSKAGNGCFKSFLRYYGLFIGTNNECFGNPYLHVIDNSISLIDIDTLPDFLLAEEVIKEGLFDFNSGKLNGSNSSDIH